MPPKRKKKAEPKSRGLTAAEVRGEKAPAAAAALADQIANDGGSVLSNYRDPLGGHWQVLAALPIELVDPTPFQPLWYLWTREVLMWVALLAYAIRLALPLLVIFVTLYVVARAVVRLVWHTLKLFSRIIRLRRT